MFCKNCGSLIGENNAFCTVCGARVDAETQNERANQPNAGAGQQYAAGQPDMGAGQQYAADHPDMGAGQQYAANQPNAGEGQQYAADHPDMAAGQQYAANQQFTNYQQNFENQPFEPANFAQGQIPPQAQKKKRKKGGFIIAGVVAVAAVSSVGVLAASGRLGNFVHKNFTSPESYFKYVAENNTKDAIKSFNTGYSKAVDSFDQVTSVNGSYTVRLDAGNELKPLIGMIDPSLKDIDNASISVNTSSDDSVQNVQLKANINDADIATVNASIDMENEEGYLQIPELSDSYIDISDGIEEINDELKSSGVEYQEMLDEVKNTLPDAKTVDKVLNTYVDVAFDNISDVSKSSDKIEAEDVSQSVTALTTTLDGQYAYDTAYEMLETLKDDENIKEIIENIDEASYDEFRDSISDTLDSLKDEKDSIDDVEGSADLTLYVNGKGEIAGTEVLVDVDGQEVVVSSVMPRSGSKFGYEMKAEYEGMELFSLTGSGTLKSDVMNGTFNVSVDDELLGDLDEYVSGGDNILTIDVKDFDISDSKDGMLNGSFTFSTDAVRQVKGYKLNVEFATTKKETSVAVALLYEDDNYAKVTLTSGEGENLKTLQPSGSDTVYSITDDSDMQDYLSEIDIDAFIDDINDKCGLDIDLDDLEDMGENLDDMM